MRRRRHELDRHAGYIAPAPPLDWSASEKSVAVGELLDAGGYLGLITRSRVDWAKSPYETHRIVAAFVLFERMRDWGRTQCRVGDRDYWTFCPFAEVIAAVASCNSASDDLGGPALAFKPVPAWRREQGWDVGVFGRRFPSSEPAFHPIGEVLSAAEEWWRAKIDCW